MRKKLVMTLIMLMFVFFFTFSFALRGLTTGAMLFNLGVGATAENWMVIILSIAFMAVIVRELHRL